MFRGDAGRRGLSPVPIPTARPQIRWSHATGAPVFASPVLDGQGGVYVGNLDGAFHALDRDGRPRWTVTLGGAIFSSAALSGSDILVGSDADALFCLDRRTGRMKWRLPLGPCPRVPGYGPENARCNGDASPLLLPDGTIIMAADAVYAVTPAGRVRWRFPLPRHAFASPARDEAGHLYVGTQGGGLLSLGETGGLRWILPWGADLDATPVAVPGGRAVLAAGDDGLLLALDAATGLILWKVPTRGAIRGSPALGPDGTIYVGSDDGQVRAVAPGGQVRWRYETGGPVRSSPVVDGKGQVLVGSQDGHLHAISEAGARLWTVALGSEIDSSVSVAPDGTLVVGCDDGRIVALR